MATVKFSSKMDAKLLKELRAIAKEGKRTLASVLDDAAAEYLERARVRPAVRDATRALLTEHEELLRRLAK